MKLVSRRNPRCDSASWGNGGDHNETTVNAKEGDEEEEEEDKGTKGINLPGKQDASHAVTYREDRP